jgi:hypothetical protein
MVIIITIMNILKLQFFTKSNTKKTTSYAFGVHHNIYSLIEPEYVYLGRSAEIGLHLKTKFGLQSAIGAHDYMHLRKLFQRRVMGRMVYNLTLISVRVSTLLVPFHKRL